MAGVKNLYSAAVDMTEIQQRLDQRGFTGTIHSHKAEIFTLFFLEIRAVKHGVALEPLIQAIDVNGIFLHDVENKQETGRLASRYSKARMSGHGLVRTDFLVHFDHALAGVDGVQQRVQDLGTLATAEDRRVSAGMRNNELDSPK
jgi:hypothetical protein